MLCGIVDLGSNTIRLSIGIERAEDLIAALETAFQAVRNGER